MTGTIILAIALVALAACLALLAFTVRCLSDLLRDVAEAVRLMNRRVTRLEEREQQR